MKVVTFSANTSWYLFNFRASSIRRLMELGYRVVCISPKDEYSQKLTQELKCDWVPLEMSNHGSNPFRDAGLIFQFYCYYRELKPVASLHFTIKNNVYGTWACRVLGVPAINNVSGLGTAFIHGGFVAAIVRLLYRTSQPFAHRIFCQNQEDFDQLIRAKLVPPERLHLLPGSGVDLIRFHPSLKEPHTGPFRFLYAGRMLADKGLSELVAAIKTINSRGTPCQLWLSGFSDVQNVSAISNDQLSEWDTDPGIEWLGPTDSMEDIYARVDCVVLPSYREGLPRSLLEAGAMGLPVVATNVPGCRHIVENGFNGLLCEAQNVDSLTHAMKALLAMSDEQRSKLGDNGRTRVAENYGESLVIEATVQAVDSALHSRKST